MINENFDSVSASELSGSVRKSDRLLSNRDVRQKISLSRTWIYNAVREKRFPSPVLLGHRRLWRESDVDGWIAGL